MDVSIEPHQSQNISTRVMETLPQYRVRVDGRAVGYIAFKPGSRLCLFARFGPVERKEIEGQVATLLEQESVNSATAPEVPDDMMKPKDTTANDDDFDS